VGDPRKTPLGAPTDEATRTTRTTRTTTMTTRTTTMTTRTTRRSLDLRSKANSGKKCGPKCKANRKRLRKEYG
jgi:hypothetical protein